MPKITIWLDEGDLASLEAVGEREKPKRSPEQVATAILSERLQEYFSAREIRKRRKKKHYR